VPATDLVFYRDETGTVPVLEWFRVLRTANQKAYANCIAKIRLLRAFGNELRRPHVDYLRDGIFELRAKDKHVQYRILFFYHGRNVAILAHALTKEKVVPAIEIERAIKRKRHYEKAPEKHRAVEPVPQNPDHQ
jgi:hypothetical protein